MAEPVMHNIFSWIKDNEQYFDPPVCLKMMHDGQLKVFFVGGPNERKDYHIDCGEELFFQVKGDMCLKVVEQGKHRDIAIKEGQIFRLPARIPHSPQRIANTVGLMIERLRFEKAELDGARYFQMKDSVPTLDILYEEWYQCADLGVHLTEVIRRFLSSEQYKTGKPLPGDVPTIPPFEIDCKTRLAEPFDLLEWLNSNREEIRKNGFKELFDSNKDQYKVFVSSSGSFSKCSPICDTWMWQLEGKSVVKLSDGRTYDLLKDDSLLVPATIEYTVLQDADSFAFVAYQDPTKCSTWPTIDGI